MRIPIYRDSAALVHYQFRMVSSNIPSLIALAIWLNTSKRDGDRVGIRFGGARRQEPGLHLVRALEAEQLRGGNEGS